MNPDQFSDDSTASEFSEIVEKYDRIVISNAEADSSRSPSSGSTMEPKRKMRKLTNLLDETVDLPKVEYKVDKYLKGSPVPSTSKEPAVVNSFILSDESQEADWSNGNKKVLPFKCSFCTKSFLYKNSLGRHEKYSCGKNPEAKCHDAPFECTTCFQRFRQAKLLTHHQKHDCKRTFTCPYCEKVFQNRISSKHLAQCRLNVEVDLEADEKSEHFVISDSD